MKIGVLGINHKSAEIAVREYVSKAVLSRISRESEIGERLHCVTLSTCNRTEIYFSADNLAEAHSELLQVLREEIPLAFEHKLYSYFGVDCFLHLSRVTAGMDSVIIAESEIQRQVKSAYELTLVHYALPSVMHYLFQKCLKLGKLIRSSLPLTQNQVTIPKILFQISEHLFHSLSALPVLFIGNSEINRKVMAYFKRKGVKKIDLCTRSVLSAKEMAEKEQISLLSWEQISVWQEYPVVICGSNAPHYLLKEAGHALQTRLVFDLSMPRNVAPHLARHPQLTLLNMEELSALLEQKQEKNLIEINRAEAVLFEGVQRYLYSFHQKAKRVYQCA